MDPVCHTLVGAAMGEAGLKRRTRLGGATLLIGANMPDLDVVALLWGPTTALAVRRGWTHGVLALVVLPLVLTAVMWGWSRLRPGESESDGVVRPGQILLLSAVSVLSHPVLDFLNVYGMRWLMPFVDRWFYGDVLFIVDPWVWAALAAGIMVAARRGTGSGAVRGPRVALAAVGLYIGLMALGTAGARAAVAARTDGAGGARFMVGPVPLNPFVRSVVVADGDGYRLGTVTLMPGADVALDPVVIDRGAWDDPVVRRAIDTPEARDFLYWARFPFVVVEQGRETTAVHFIDARYAADVDARFGVLRVDVPANP